MGKLIKGLGLILGEIRWEIGRGSYWGGDLLTDVTYWIIVVSRSIITIITITIISISITILMIKV